VIEMMNDAQVALMVRESWKAEIERAVDRVKAPKRTELDQWFRRQWHREAAVSQWPEWRQKQYREWRRRNSQPTRPKQLTAEEDAWRELKEQKRKRVAWVDKAMKGIW